MNLLAYLLLILAAFGIAGAIDLAEEERLSLRGYLAERVELATTEKDNTHGR